MSIEFRGENYVLYPNAFSITHDLKHNEKDNMSLHLFRISQIIENRIDSPLFAKWDFLLYSINGKKQKSLVASPFVGNVTTNTRITSTFVLLLILMINE